MAYTDLPQDISYHSLHNLYVRFFEKRSVSVSCIVIGFLFLYLQIYFFCSIVKTILERFASILLYTKTS